MNFMDMIYIYNYKQKYIIFHIYLTSFNLKGNFFLKRECIAGHIPYKNSEEIMQKWH